MVSFEICIEQVSSFYPLLQIGTGFTDDVLEKHHTFLKDHVTPGPKSYYAWDSQHEPDHWFEPVQVWEIKASDLSISPTHKAAMGLVRVTYSIEFSQNQHLRGLFVILLLFNSSYRCILFLLKISGTIVKPYLCTHRS